MLKTLASFQNQTDVKDSLKLFQINTDFFRGGRIIEIICKVQWENWILGFNAAMWVEVKSLHCLFHSEVKGASDVMFVRA